MRDKIISFIWQHFLLLISIYVMTLGVAVCVRSQLGSSVISTIPYVMASAGAFMDAIPAWTIHLITVSRFTVLFEYFLYFCGVTSMDRQW